MTEAQAIEAISAQFAASWPAASGSIPFALENEALPSADSFALLTVIHTTSQQLSHGQAGARRFQRNGYALVKIWTPIDQGRAGFSTLAEAACSVLEGKSLGGSSSSEPVTTLAAATAEAGSDGRWFMGVVRVAFYYFVVR